MVVPVQEAVGAEDVGKSQFALAVVPLQAAPSNRILLTVVRLLPVASTSSVLLVSVAVESVDSIVPVPVGKAWPLTDVTVATPSVGVTSIGESEKTNRFVPVSLLITPASCADVVDAKTERLFAV